MLSLREWQAAFAAALMDPAGSALPRGIHEGAVSRRERFDPYRASVRGNYRKALHAVYPAVAQLVGARFFDHAADAFARARPSHHGDLNRFGEGFAEFLAEFPGADALAYLPDVARLEWAMEEVFHAADLSGDHLDGLAALPESDYPALRLALSPACRLLASHWPVDRLWALNQPGVAWDEAFDIEGGGVRLLVRRIGYEVEAVPLGEAEFEFLRDLGAGRRLGSACARAARRYAGFAPAPALQRHLLDATLLPRKRVAPTGGAKGRRCRAAPADR